MEIEMQTLADIDTVVYSTFLCITKTDCCKWIEDSAIYKEKLMIMTAYNAYTCFPMKNLPVSHSMDTWLDLAQLSKCS